MAADGFESYEVAPVAAIILAAYAVSEKDFVAVYGAGAGAFAMKLIIFALILRGVGVFSSIIGIMAVRGPDSSPNRRPIRPINQGYLPAPLRPRAGFFLLHGVCRQAAPTGPPPFR